MKTITIAVHCYAEKHPVFASMLTAQLSSLVHWKPEECAVGVAVYCSPDDMLTAAVIDSFSDQLPVNVVVTPIELPLNMLFKRGIGRNLAARDLDGDIFWFIDCDYLLGPGCLDTLSRAEFQAAAFPREVQIHRSHRLGDEEIAKIVPGTLFEPDLSIYEPKRERYAIGGLQIVRGEVAKLHGYLPDTKWTKPLTDVSAGFQDTREDKAYRASVGPWEAIELPNLYRMRHSSSAFEPAEYRLKQTAGKT